MMQAGQDSGAAHINVLPHEEAPPYCAAAGETKHLENDKNICQFPDTGPQ